jgi:prepilin-type N-terminal cleavage/methylation domain-containing protein
MNAAHRNLLGPRGVTLIELLVVISILMLLMVFAVPAARPALEARRLREAARQVSTYLARAQTEAARTGRPVGVELRRDASVPQMCTVLQQVEVPPPYAGDTLSSRMISVPDAGNPWLAQIGFPGGETLPDLVNRDLLHVGDLLQLNYQGHYWRIEAIDAANSKLGFSSHTAPGAGGGGGGPRAAGARRGGRGCGGAGFPFPRAPPRPAAAR